MNKGYTPEEVMELIQMDIQLEDNLPSCSIANLFQDPNDYFVVKAVKTIKSLFKCVPNKTNNKK